jgi:hypothetical protein
LKTLTDTGTKKGGAYTGGSIIKTKNSITKVEIIPKNEQNIYRTRPGDMYYVLYNDGCYHLGIELQAQDGTIWWIPVGDGYDYDWCCTNTICMNEEEFANMC